MVGHSLRAQAARTRTMGRMWLATQRRIRNHQEMEELTQAVQELATEMQRFNQNMEKITEYQASLLRVNKLMCFWMENTQELIKYRSQMSQPPESTLRVLRK